MLVTKNITPGESVYGEKRISVESSSIDQSLTNGDVAPATKTEYRVWNPFRYVKLLKCPSSTLIEPQIKARSRHTRRSRRDLHKARSKSAIPRSSKWHISLTRRGYRWPNRDSLRSRILAPIRPRSHQYGHTPHKRHPNCRRRPSPSQIPHACLYGGCDLRGCCATGSGSNCGDKCAYVSSFGPCLDLGEIEVNEEAGT